VGAEIEVYAVVGGRLKQVVAAKSVRGGAYNITVSDIDVISDISYDHAGWQPRVVRDVSARSGDDEVIHKVLLDRQGPKRFLPILEQVHEYEGLYYLGRELAGPDASEVSVRQAARKKYLSRILAMPDPLRHGPDPRTTPPADPDRDPQRAIVSKLRPDEQALLADKIADLFELYGIPRYGDLHLTRWKTTMVLSDGRPSQAFVTIVNGRGNYSLVRNNVQIGQGKLSKISVSDSVKDTIEGSWATDSEKGFFQWTFVPGHPEQFIGNWGYDAQNGPVGQWQGLLTPWP
jgi:hypothetical protein